MLKILGYIWSAPHSIVGLLLALYYWPKAWRISEGCIEAIPRNTIIGGKGVGAQTHGCVIYYRDEKARSWKSLRVHERRHVLQGMIGGVFFVLAYVGTFLWFYLRAPDKGWYPAYMEIPFEKAAYRYSDEFARGLHADAWGSKETRG